MALYDQTKQIAEATIRHALEEINRFERIPDQKNFRKVLIENFLETNHTRPEELQAVVGRGGLLKPIPGGTYLVNEKMLADLEAETYNTHASNLGAILAHEFAIEQNIPAYIVDPVVVDELEDIARISGLKGINRRSVGHALNQKAVARQVLEEAGLTYEEGNVVVVHLGGGISMAAHKKGRMIEMINGLDGEGPYSPERTGTLPLIELATKMTKENLTLPEVRKILAGNGGIKSYLQETDIRLIEQRINEGDTKAKKYLDGMCYQIAKYIGYTATVLKGETDYIILTGGISYSKYVTNQIREYVEWIAEVKVIPGEKEMDALFEGAKRVLDGVEEVKQYDEVKQREAIK